VVENMGIWTRGRRGRRRAERGDAPCIRRYRTRRYRRVPTAPSRRARGRCRPRGGPASTREVKCWYWYDDENTTARARVLRRRASVNLFPLATFVPGAPLSDARVARRAKRPPPCRNARVAPISRTRWRSSSAFPRASPPAPARGSLRPREDPALTRCFPLPSPSLPPRSPQEGAAAEREDPDRRVEGPREARCEGERAAGAPQGDGRGGG